MAGLVESFHQGLTPGNEELAKLFHNPFFSDLQATLATDCSQQQVPYTLISDDPRGCGSDSDKENASFDLIVEDATLQAEFRQMAALNNARVVQLEAFYNTQSAAILTQRSDAMARVQSRGLPVEQQEQELKYVHRYYDRQQHHLTTRVSKSLQLLKASLPLELAQPGGTTKKNKSRLLCPKAVRLMSDWYDRHQENPYPTDEEKQELAEKGGVSVSQVKAWFANKRNRTLNTRPKRQKMEMQKKLLNACDNLHATSQDPNNNSKSNDTNGKAKNFHALMQEMSAVVRDTTNQNQWNFLNQIPLSS